MAKLACRRKPRRSVHAYSRCAPGTAGPRKHWRQRRAKVCLRGAGKVRVSGHQRRVCVGLHVRG